eukprot:jgi/Picsp_1/6536/NSC_03879-R1_translation elongation factor ef- subunit
MADSWEEHEEKIGTSSSSILNPGASSFSFNPTAGSFLPKGAQNAAPLEKTSAEKEQPTADVQPTGGSKDSSSIEDKELKGNNMTERYSADIEKKLSKAKIQQEVAEVVNEEDDTIEESGRKQKVEDVLSLLNAEDPREHMNVVFIGHVDAGKSTTAGQILFLTGGVDDRTIEKYEREAKEKNRESWYMAYIMDTNEEERAKASILPL